MGNRRCKQVATSDDDDDGSAPPRNSRNVDSDVNENQRKAKNVLLPDEEEDENEVEEPKLSELNENEEEGAEHEGNDDSEAQPLGEIVRVSGKGKSRRTHYESFEYDRLQYELEDSVLLIPEQENQKPYVAIIKDITQTQDGALMVTGQWFYRPDEAEKEGGGHWQLSDARELFFSFHRDEVDAESVMHKCVVHFIPQNKQIPKARKHPGFIVQKVYDPEKKRLYNLTDKDYEDNKQYEIDLLVQKTLSCIGDLPDLEPEDVTVDHEDQMKNKSLSRKRNMPKLGVTRNDGRSRLQLHKAENLGSNAGSASDYYAILVKFDLLTGETQRDKWLEKLLQSVQFVCAPVHNKQNNKKEQGVTDVRSPVAESRDKIPSGDVAFVWPDAAVTAVVALEKVAHDTLSADFQKYNQKMRQLAFNLKNGVLARRLLNKELQPAEILNMSPNELKEGLTAEEITNREPEEPKLMQMTDARCTRCSEKQVALKDIIHTGREDRYQLECVGCGNNWYGSRDDASALTIEGPSSGNTVGPAPLATAKFEKNLVSPEKGSIEDLKKTTEESPDTTEAIS